MMKELVGGITIVPGIKAAGIHCGIKPRGKDLALIVSEPPAVAAGLFTRNKIQAESLKLTLSHIKYGWASAILINSGNANCCTGTEGYSQAEEVAFMVANYLHTDPRSVLLASTGVIGKKLPWDRVKSSLPELIKRLSPKGSREAAEAILTTDKKIKETAWQWEHKGQIFYLGGIAKGAGMIQPELATMLCFLATDLNIDRDLLQSALKKAVDKSFNRITIDGDTSTNDTVICLANGTANNTKVCSKNSLYRSFQEALDQATFNLAQLLIKDGEGVNKVVKIRVIGAGTVTTAQAIARSLANSLLVKTAFYGEDPNWGRMMMAIGKAGIQINPEKINITLDDLPIVQNGIEILRAWEEEARKILRQKEFCVTINLNLGKAESVMWTSDLSVDYVQFNSQYLT
jgi:glutamate N-acetyltransferase/amino-acid N-acetyltransferase